MTKRCLCRVYSLQNRYGINTLLKAGCLDIYLLAVIGAFIAFPPGAATVLKNDAAILLGLYLLELLLVFKKISRHSRAAD